MKSNKTLLDELNNKLEKEYNEFIQEIIKLDPLSIINKTYEITLKQEIKDLYVGSDILDRYEIKALLERNNTLKYLYESWLEYDFDIHKEVEELVQEDTVSGYETTINGYNIINKHTPKLININVEKIWNDDNNNDGLRPESITIRLYKGEGADKVEVTSVTLTSANATTNDNWTYTYKNLPKYENGTEITYIVREDELVSTLGYTTTYDDANYKIFNTYRTEIIRIEGTKTWNDDNNRDGIRPETIEVTLTGKVGTREVYKETKIVSASDNWSYVFEDLAKYDAGSIIDYKISENNVADNSTTIDNYNITNTHTPDMLTITGKKVWDDAENQDGKRPESITVILNKTVKGETTEVTRTTVIEDNEGNWTFTFTDLYAKEDGEDIIYTVDEITVDGYTKSIEDYTITNTHTPETISYNLTKNWEDYDNNDGLRPEKITIKVYANNELVKTIEMSAENNWTATTGDLPKYNNGEEFETIKIIAENNWTYTLKNLQKYKKGQEIKYTIEEEKLDNYETKYDGYTITNSYIEQEIITPPNTGVKEAISSNTYCELIVLLLGALGIIYTLKKREN